MTEAEESTMIPKPSEEDIKPKFPYMDKIIKASRTINMWPKKEKSDSFLHHSKVWLIIITSTLYFLCCCIKLATDYRKLESVGFLVDSIMGTLAATFRYIFVYVRGDKYLLLASLIHNKFIHYSLFPKRNRISMLKYYFSANKLILVYGPFTMFWMLQTCGMPLVTFIWQISTSSVNLNETKPEIISYPVSMRVYAPFDYKKQPANAILYAYNFVLFMTIMWIYVVADSLWFMVTFLTIGQFALLRDSMDTLSEIVRKKGSMKGFESLTESETLDVENGLKHCIRHHQFLREFARLLDEISSPNILVDSLHSVVSLGFVLLEITVALKLGDGSRFLHSLQYLMSLTARIYIYDRLGNELTVNEEEFAEAINNFPLYICPKQRPLLMIMSLQANRPCVLTGGKMFKVNLEFFTSLMQLGFSYFTFFLQFTN